MNLKSNLVIIIALCLFLTSCTDKKKSNQSNGQNGISVAEGTFAGIVHGTDGETVYKMVALNAKGFEMMSKSIGIDGIAIDKGALKRSGDSTFIDNVAYCIDGNKLCNGTDTLVLLDKNKTLPLSLKQQYMIESKGNGTAVLERYTQDGETIAKLSFSGKNYLLKLNEQNSQINEYSDGKNHLEMEIIDPAPELETIPVFYNGKDKHEFKIASPVNYMYTSKDNVEYDVLYLNGDAENLAMLINRSITSCFILPQTTAWSKGAVYSKGKLSWKTNGTKAQLLMGGKVYSYNRKTIRKY